MLELINVFVGGLITALSVIVFGRLILKQELFVSKKKLLIFLIFITLIIQFLYIVESRVIRTIVAFSLYACSLKFAYKLSPLKTFVMGIFCGIIMTVSDILTILICVLIFGNEFFYNVIAAGVLSNFIVSLILIFVTFIFRKLLSKLVNTKITNNLLILSVLIIICVIYVFYYAYSNINMEINDFLGLFCILVLLIVLINLFLQTYRNNKLVNEYDKLLEFIKKYEVEIDKQRLIRHETKNQLLTIKSKIIDKDKNKNIVNYIDELLKDNKKINHSEYAKFKSLPANGLKGLFYYKVSLAEDKNISVVVSVSNSIEKSFLTDLDSFSFNQICKVLGVFLDNAIEGAELSFKKAISIEVYETNKEEIMFVISNTYDNKIKTIFGKSSKGFGRGYGLMLVNNIISSNFGKFSHSTEVFEDLYIQKFIVKK